MAAGQTARVIGQKSTRDTMVPCRDEMQLECSSRNNANVWEHLLNEGILHKHVHIQILLFSYLFFTTIFTCHSMCIPCISLGIYLFPYGGTPHDKLCCSNSANVREQWTNDGCWFVFSILEFWFICWWVVLPFPECVKQCWPSVVIMILIFVSANVSYYVICRRNVEIIMHFNSVSISFAQHII